MRAILYGRKKKTITETCGERNLFITLFLSLYTYFRDEFSKRIFIFRNYKKKKKKEVKKFKVTVFFLVNITYINQDGNTKCMAKTSSILAKATTHERLRIVFSLEFF